MLTILLYFAIAVIAITEPLKCYDGSKGVLNEKPISSFIERTCEEGMIHCFESYSDDFTEITASCQTLNTDPELLNVCKTGCLNHPDLNVTVCCCDTDLCNLPDSEKPTKGPAVVMRALHGEQPRSPGGEKLSPSV